MYIQNRRDSSKINGCSPLQLLCSLTGNRPQSATFNTATVASNLKRQCQHENWIKNIINIITKFNLWTD
jgi:hypothetical protein